LRQARARHPGWEPAVINAELEKRIDYLLRVKGQNAYLPTNADCLCAWRSSACVGALAELPRDR
jgi:hypothetical protein